MDATGVPFTSARKVKGWAFSRLGVDTSFCEAAVEPGSVGRHGRPIQGQDSELRAGNRIVRERVVGVVRPLDQLPPATELQTIVEDGRIEQAQGVPASPRRRPGIGTCGCLVGRSQMKREQLDGDIGLVHGGSTSA